MLASQEEFSPSSHTNNNCPKFNKAKINSPILPHSLTQQETERYSPRRNLPTKNINELFLKTTERHQTKNPNSPVLISQNSSPLEQHSHRWEFSQQMNEQTEQIKGIEEFLEKEGLLQIFNCFQHFRNLMVESLSESETIFSVKGKIQLYQAICNLKEQLKKITQSATKNINHSKNKEQKHLQDQNQDTLMLLMQISQLRKQNDQIRNKNIQMVAELNKYQNSDYSIQNSLINNSISFGGSSIKSQQQIEYLEEDCFSIDFKMDNMGNGHRICNNIVSKSTTISLENSLRKIIQGSQIVENVEGQSINVCSFSNSRVISEQSSYQVNSEEAWAEQVVLCTCDHQKWKDLVNDSIKTIKFMFKNQFQASNLAFIKSSNLQKLQNILKSYKSFHSGSVQQIQSNFLLQAAKLISFIQDHSKQLSNLVRQEMKMIKISGKQ